MFTDEEELTITAEVKRLLDKIDEMKKQRENLEQQFRDSVMSDDITTTLVTREDGDREVG